MRAKDTYGCGNAPISLLRSCKQGLQSRKTWHLAPPPGSHSLSQQSYSQWRISRVVWALGSHRVPTRQWSRGRRSVYARAALAATAGGTVLAGQAQGRKRGQDDPGGEQKEDAMLQDPERVNLRPACGRVFRRRRLCDEHLRSRLGRKANVP